MPQSKTTNPDGRRARSERSRQVIIAAMIALVDDGILIPTAQQVSERAGVGIRTVFRHFSDMESLYAQMDTRVREQHQEIFAGGDRQGELDERLLHAVEQHALAYEGIGKLFLSTRAQRWRYEVLRKQYARTQQQIRADLEDWLPELKALSGQEREMVDAVASFETWERLREHQSLSKKTSIDLVAALLRKIIL
jgi:AcrR family transcriptional regulator